MRTSWIVPLGDGNHPQLVSQHQAPSFSRCLCFRGIIPSNRQDLDRASSDVVVGEDRIPVRSSSSSGGS